MNESTDLIHGKIWKAILWFSIPMLVGNLFQQLYNTVDSYVVGNFVSSGALAAVGQSTPIINTLVGFFTGLATGAGVVIAQYFGGNHLNKMKKAIHTSIALTLILCLLFTILGIGLSRQILILIGSPDSVMAPAALYLRIYFGGISFVCIYNMGSGILRAVGDSKTPLYYLIIASIINIILDFVFVLYFHKKFFYLKNHIHHMQPKCIVIQNLYNRLVTYRIRDYMMWRTFLHIKFHYYMNNLSIP